MAPYVNIRWCHMSASDGATCQHLVVPHVSIKWCHVSTSDGNSSLIEKYLISVTSTAISLVMSRATSPSLSL